MKKDLNILFIVLLILFFSACHDDNVENNKDPKTSEDGVLNKLEKEIIDFTPTDNGFVRIVIGKDSKDRFYIANIPSDRKGIRGSAYDGKLEVTSDFVKFSPIWKGAGQSSDGIELTNITQLNPMQVKELGNGNLLVAAGYVRCDLSANDGANAFSGYFILSANHETIKLCSYTDLKGEAKIMNTTHHIIKGKKYYSNQPVYDWSTFIYGNIVLATEYGDRVDSGMVWYSEDYGENFKQIFWMPNHYNDGVTNGNIVSQSHVHGVMYDHYKARIYIIAGEDNSNLFWSDKGINTSDCDWHVENIRNQKTQYNQLSIIQAVNGYPFKDCLVFGSDLPNMGAILRINRSGQEKLGQIVIAHQIFPQVYKGTLYCAGGMTKRDLNSPLLICMTREGAMANFAQQTELMKQHLGRIVATYDGFNFFEVWRDDTYGSYECFNEKKRKIENREFTKCTREMNAWLCNNGDLIIKYAGRDYVYMTADYSEKLYSNICSQVVRYKKVQEKF